MKYFFIESERLGSVVEVRILSLANGTGTKRQKQQSFRRLARLLVDLGLAESDVAAIGYGLNSAGKTGAVLACSSTHIEGDVKP